MHKLRRLIVIAVGALIGLGAVVLVGVNLYVQSQAAQGKIQQELSRSLGVPLKIRSMSVTPWGGLELSGITIPQTVAVGPRNFLEARTFRLRVRFLSLFSRRLVIKEVSLVGPRIVWPQNKQGKWRLPSTRTDRPRAVAAPQPPAIPETDTGVEVVQMNATRAVPNPAEAPSQTSAKVKDKSPEREPRLAVAPEVRPFGGDDLDLAARDRRVRRASGTP